MRRAQMPRISSSLCAFPKFFETATDAQRIKNAEQMLGILRNQVSVAEHGRILNGRVQVGEGSEAVGSSDAR